MPGVYGTQNCGTERFDVFFFTHAVGFPFEQMLAMISLLGGGIMDYCHWDCRFPDSVRLIAERDRLSERAKARVLGENALRFFGFGESQLGKRRAPAEPSKAAR